MAITWPSTTDSLRLAATSSSNSTLPVNWVLDIRCMSKKRAPSVFSGIIYAKAPATTGDTRSPQASAPAEKCGGLLRE